MAYEWADEPFQRKSWQVRLEDTIPDTLYTLRDGSDDGGAVKALPKPGAIRIEDGIRGAGQYKNVRCTGKCEFMWGCNRRGSALTVGLVAAVLANLAVTQDEGSTGVTDTVGTFTDEAAFVEGEEVGNLLYILDDAGAAGAAPEGEWAVVIKNDADTLFLQPDLTTAPAVGDTGVLMRNNGAVTIGAIGNTKYFTAGVTMAASVADNEWGWFLRKGLVEAAIVAAGTTVSITAGMIVTTGGLLTNSSTSALSLMVARALSAYTTDTVKRIVPVWFNVKDETYITT